MASGSAGAVASFLDILVRPRAAFQSATSNQRWLSPLVATSLVVLGCNFMIVRSVGVGSITREALRTNPRAAEIAETAQQHQLLSEAILCGGQLVIALLLIMASGGFFFLLFGLSGVSIVYKQLMAVVAYSFFVYFLATNVLALVVLALSGDRSHFSLANPIVSSVGDFLDPARTNPFAYSIASSLDVFSVWCLFLLATGFTVSPRLGARQAWAVVLGAWAAYVLLTSAPALFASL